ncbi:unnamed protein product [Calypogeia fissa]
MDRPLLVTWVLVQVLLRLMAPSGVCTIAQDVPTRLNFPPAIFAFGDSMIDPGNNNFIQSLAKANILYNGIDFPLGPSGRFCNGRTVLDVICDIFQVPYLPAYLDPQTNGSRILGGVNYASGAAGILDDTGANFIETVTMDQQIGYFRHTLDDLNQQLGEEEARERLSKSLLFVEIGNNDFINNYFLSSSNTSQLHTAAEFNSVLINRMAAQLSDLYGLGFRKVFVSGVGPVGCIPHQLALAQTPQCVQPINHQVQDFNNGLMALLDQLTGTLPGVTFTFGNTFGSLMSIIADPAAHGFQVANEGCCGSGLYRGQFPCQMTASVCFNRNQYVFWDPYHTTEAANVILADQLYDGGPDQISPINLHQLIDLL